MSYTRRMARSVFAVVLGVLLAAPAGAITVAPLTFTELVHASALVLYVRVSDVRGQWTEDRQGIESVVTADVLSVFKGSPGATVTLTLPGGQVGRYRNVLPGAPSLSTGDLAVVFLTARGPRLPITTGLTQGVYRVTVDARTGVVVAPPILDGAGDGNSRIVRGDPQRKPMGLAAFEAAVKTAGEATR